MMGMKRTLWKWLFGISLAVLILLVLFTVAAWLLVNVGGALLAMLLILAEDVQINAISFSAFLANFVGSPLFYIYLADLAVLISSSVALFLTRKQKT